MKPILMILTGGTIGSTLENGIIRTETDSCRALCLYRQVYGSEVSFSVVNLMNVLSENLQKTHWETIVNYLREADLSDYSGIIITHGSDTLSYSSAFLGLCLNYLSIPVVLTAADLIPDDPKSNAVCNIRAAVLVITSMKRGVYTVYRNPDDNCCTVYIATRIQEADRFSGYFSAPYNQPFGMIQNDRLIILQKDINENIPYKMPVLTLSKQLQLNYDVMMIKPYPGMDYSAFNLSEHCRAVLHITYHSSSASTEGSNSALAFLQYCQKHNIPFYLASFLKKTGNLYETSDTLLMNGAISVPHCTNESAYAKLLLCINLLADNHKEMMQRNWFFEVL